MSKTNEDTLSPDIENDEQHVREYLKNNPDFFDQHPDILDHLQISHSAGNAVSLVERQVSVLRERNMEMRKRLNSLMENARDNDRLFKLTRELVLALLDVDNIDSLCKVFTDHLSNDFGIEFSSIIIFGDPADSTEHCRFESFEVARREIGALFTGDKSVCGALRKDELSYLFPEGSSLGSAALQTLKCNHNIGIIAVGSADPDYYRSNMGTLFLSHIADVLVRILPNLTKKSG
jgi:uncharacterized protein YigA (DUF484 family)